MRPFRQRRGVAISAQPRYRNEAEAAVQFGPDEALAMDDRQVRRARQL
jgi:hypothetical protein